MLGFEFCGEEVGKDVAFFVERRFFGIFLF